MKFAINVLHELYVLVYGAVFLGAFGIFVYAVYYALRMYSPHAPAVASALV